MQDAMMEHMDLLLAHATGEKAISNAQAVKVERCHTWFIMPDNFTESQEVELFDLRIRLLSQEREGRIGVILKLREVTGDRSFKSVGEYDNTTVDPCSYSSWRVWTTPITKGESFPESQKIISLELRVFGDPRTNKAFRYPFSV
eukprot:g16204.t1